MVDLAKEEKGEKEEDVVECLVDAAATAAAAAAAAAAAVADAENCVCGYSYSCYPADEMMLLTCHGCKQISHGHCVGYTRTDVKRYHGGVAKAVGASTRASASAERAAEAAASTAAAAAAAEAAKHTALVPVVAADAAVAAQGAATAAAAAVAVAAAKAVAAVAAVAAAKMTPQYVCGACVAKRAGAAVSGPCGATLVVCPSPILPQWRAELARHAIPGAIRVVVYEGQPRGAGGPRANARFDP
jgi:E3 ubiquitin-protein ligase SHPRH